MNYYQFNIGDYKSHTAHLDIIEDCAYRRMLDYCYLNECGLPESVDEIARLICMRTHSEGIANVLREFFFLEDGVYKNTRVEVELFAYREKSEKAKESAKARWAKTKGKADANAMRTQSERNAKQEPLTIKQETLNNIQETYNSICADLPSCQVLNHARNKQLKARIKETNSHDNQEFWIEFFKRVQASDFLTGRKTDFKASFDWVIKQANFIKIMEGNYDNTERKPTNNLTDKQKVARATTDVKYAYENF